jgi:hypothetical protein
MKEKSDIFDKTYDHYIKKIAELDFGAVAVTLGVKTDGDSVTVPFFNTPYQVTRNGVLTPDGSPAAFGVGVVLCNYLIQCPDDIPRDDEWYSYKDFKDAAPLVGTFANTVERPIVESFSGRLSELEKAARILGGIEPATTFPYDLNLLIQALPRIPMLLLFNDADDEFPADCKILYEKRTESYLDMECVAIIGMLLAEFLKRCSSAQSK